ncbi:MAG: hypothetical protein ACRC7N_03225 [Clostridium sp.]
MFSFFGEQVSENLKNRKEIKRNLERANRIIESSNRRYKSEYSYIKRELSEINSDLHRFFRERQEIFKQIGSDVEKIVYKFENFNIDSKVIKKVNSIKNDIDFITSVNTHLVNKNYLVDSKVGIGSMLTIKNVLSIFIDNEMEVYESKGKLYEAESYEREVDMKIKDFEYLNNRINNIRNAIREEVSVINFYKDKVSELIEVLNNGMQNLQFTEKEALELKNVCMITKEINKRLNTTFIDSDLYIESEYSNNVKMVKEINAKLSNAPTVTGKTLNDILLLLGV